MQTNSLTLFEFSLMLESYISDGFKSKYFWITAEISALSIKMGHCYLNLIDKDQGSSQPKAEIKGIIWKNSLEKINNKFAGVTGFYLKKDISILFLATLNYSPRFGISLNIIEIKPEYTLGELMLEKQRTIQRLIKNGLYDKNKKLEFPIVPQKIAVLSALDSKGYEDFANVLTNNSHSYKFDLKLFPVLLQGNNAATDISKTLNYLANHKNKFDIAVLIRGGGSNIDLLCFDSYELAEAIANFPLPVVTGIGHTTDTSVADEVAYTNKETPTAVAQFIITTTREFELKLIDYTKTIQTNTLRFLEKEERFIERSLNSVNLHPKLKLKNEYLKLNFSFNRISQKSNKIIQFEQAQHSQITKDFQKFPISLINKERQSLNIIDRRVMAQDPYLQIQKGFSITKINGKTITKLSKIKIGDEIETITAEGLIKSNVKSKQYHNGRN